MKTSMEGTWSLSQNGETYFGRFETKQAAIDEGHADGKYPFWVGECEPPSQPETFWHAEDWIEHVCCQDEYNTEWAEDWDKSTREQREELEGEVRALMADWLDHYNLRPRHFNIASASVCEITAPPQEK